MSIGSKPTDQTHPRSLALLEHEGILKGRLASKSWNDLPAIPNIVITVCGNAAGETYPVYLGSAVRTHWYVADPAKAIGTEEKINAAFNQAYRLLREAIETFLSLPLDDLRKNPTTLKTKLDYINIVKFKQKYTVIVTDQDESLLGTN